jgi:hypothetical protein
MSFLFYQSQNKSASTPAGFVTVAAHAGVAERLIMQQTGHTDVRTLQRSIRDGSCSVKMPQRRSASRLSSESTQ